MANIDITRQKTYSPVLLIILDGWGLSPSWGGNAISMSNPPFINHLWRNYPHQVLQAFAPIAGPYRKVGTSEIGHSSIGAGQLINQDSNEIFAAIDSELFFKNPVLKQGFTFAKEKKSFVHMIGLFSDGNVHSNIEHLFALMEFASKERVKDLYLHFVTDGIDTDKMSALNFLADLRKKIAKLGIGKIATITGRFYAMDRDNYWDRIIDTYNAQALLEGIKMPTAEKALSEFYKKGLNDFMIPPTICADEALPRPMVPEDVVIFFNFRADRARQLAGAYVDPNIFKGFLGGRKIPLLNPYLITLTDYHLKAPAKIAFPVKKIKECLAKVVSDKGINQLHAAESEKYAHVTYFFNCGREESFPGEDRLISPTPRADNYAKIPELSTPKMIKDLTGLIKSKKHGFIVVNLANVDMIGHTGDIEAAQKAIAVIDESVKKLVDEVLSIKGAVIITADHGNAEQMIHLEEIGDPETFHTLNPVPFILVTPNNRKIHLDQREIFNFNPLTDILKTSHSLADIAPTVLTLMGLSIPLEMTGQSLIEHLE